MSAPAYSTVARELELASDQQVVDWLAEASPSWSPEVTAKVKKEALRRMSRMVIVHDRPAKYWEPETRGEKDGE